MHGEEALRLKDPLWHRLSVCERKCVYTCACERERARAQQRDSERVRKMESEMENARQSER